MAVVVVGVVLFNAVLRGLLKRAVRLASFTATGWDDALLAAAVRPLRWAVWVLALGAMARVPDSPLPETWSDTVLLWRTIGLVGCATWLAVGAAGRLGGAWILHAGASGREADATTVDAVVKLLRLLAVVLGALSVAKAIGWDLTGLLALGGVGGLALGFAAKDLLANFFGGLTIYLDRPFVVGEWIRSPDTQIEGTVEHISWRHTRVRAFNKNPIYVPNALFTTIVVENPSRMTHRRIQESVGLRYDDFHQVEAVVDAIRQMLMEHEGIDPTQTLIVSFARYGVSSLDLFVLAFTKTVDWVEFHAVRQDVLLRIGQIVEAQGAQFAFPTQTVHLAAPPEA